MVTADGSGGPDGTADAVLHALPVLVGVLLLYLGVMVAQPFVMELVPGFGRSELTGTYFGIFYVFSGVAAAVGNAVVGWAMDTGERGDSRLAALDVLCPVRARLRAGRDLAAPARVAAEPVEARRSRTCLRRDLA